ncbi:hypothetical protein Celal_3983 [Cellulophaga algicola DSM 14237]|uniref:Uncharacterized protein n=1 Tax=Cellulophaga algicola (strain DSM 14237 / IC166 / ACAM 630) TaxID=688270 RepID=E6XD40_CELAD|nr:protealysin inhibitor emfourin [Cellulophaga algicola]ADV51227.1 hypothetical protein Celal_3983 [Cellulophaga algicola DSM 14237]
MKYSLSISGGFTGITKKYAGEVSVAGTELKKIVEALNTPPLAKNENLRDGLQYHLNVQKDTENYEANFDDSNLPSPIRSLITTILNQK